MAADGHGRSAADDNAQLGQSVGARPEDQGAELLRLPGLCPSHQCVCVLVCVLPDAVRETDRMAVWTVRDGGRGQVLRGEALRGARQVRHRGGLLDCPHFGDETTFRKPLSKLDALEERTAERRS